MTSTTTTDDTTNDKGLALQSLLLDIPSLDLTMICRNCTNDGLINMLPKFLYNLKASKVMSAWEVGWYQLAQILRSDDVQSYIDTMSSLCHIPENGSRVGQNDLSLERVRILGLDSIKTLNILELLGPQPMQNSLEFNSLSLEVIISEMAKDSEFVQSSEEITFSLELGRVDVSVAVFLALELEQLGNIPLSSVMDMKNLIPYILDSLT